MERESLSFILAHIGLYGSIEISVHFTVGLKSENYFLKTSRISVLSEVVP